MDALTLNPPERFQNAIRHFDEHNAKDPNVESVNGNARPHELLQAERLTAWVLKLAPEASEELLLAARCQHLRRWEIPRADYPLDRAGYLKWRSFLKAFHAEKSGEILRTVGYPDETIHRVQELNLKKNFPHDPESRVLEDALCLVFLEHQFADLARKTTPEKMVNALRKSWQKMTSAAHQHALTLHYTDEQKALLERALEAET